MKNTHRSTVDEKIAREKWLEARLRRIWQKRKNLHQTNNGNNQTIAQRSEVSIQCIPEAI